jgi:hypothetical protein
MRIIMREWEGTLCLLSRHERCLLLSLYPLPVGEGTDGISLAVNSGQMLFGRKFSQEVLHMLSCVVTAVSLGTEEGGP